MKMIICSVYDSATEAYMRPFAAQSEGQAIRSFEDETNKQGSEINAHPEDYALFKVADWNDNTATVVSDIKCLRRAHEVNKEILKLKEA